MLRALFCSLGLFVSLTGAQLLLVDRMILNLVEADIAGSQYRKWFTVGENSKLILDPPEWVAYVLTSVGVVTVLYAVALPRPVKEEHH